MKDIHEARRYLSNAKEILREKALKEDGFYKNRKYVKMAGHTAYSGVLVALDSVFGDKKRKKKCGLVQGRAIRTRQKNVVYFYCRIRHIAFGNEL